MLREQQEAHISIPCSICVQSLASTAAHSLWPLTFMVVKVVEPELQGPDTAGMENYQGKKETVKICSPHSSLLLCHKKRGWKRAFTKHEFVNLRERTVAQPHQHALNTDTQPDPKHQTQLYMCSCNPEQPCLQQDSSLFCSCVLDTALFCCEEAAVEEANSLQN